MAYTSAQMTTALALLKARLNRASSDTTLDDYLTPRLQATYEELSAVQGITIDADSINELMFWVDATAYAYQNRDKPGTIPAWMQLQRRELFLAKHSEEWKEAQDDS